MASYISNVAKLASGSVFGQLVVLFALPLMAKLFSPEQFGIAQSALSVLSVLLIVGSLRLEIAVLSVPDAELVDLFRCAWWLSVCTAAGVFIVAISVTLLLQSAWTNEQRLSTLLLPFVGLFATWNQLMGYLGLRWHAFGPSANAKVIYSVGYAVTALGIGFVRASAAVLLSADTLARASTSVYMVRVLNLKLSYFALPSWSLLRNTLYRHRELAGIGLLSSLVNAAGSAFTAAMLLWLFGAFEAGQYAMVDRMVGMPIGLISAAIAQVFMANLSKSISNGDLNSARIEYRRLLRALMLIGLGISPLVFFVAPYIINLLLGEGWETAGGYAKALTLLYMSACIAGPLNMTLTVLGRLRLQLIWDFMRFVIVATSWTVIWIMDLNSELALWIYSTAAFVSYAIFLALTNWAMTGSVCMIGRSA